MNRKQTLEGSFLFQGFEVANVQIYPLSANRRTFLRIMGNSICDGQGGEGDDTDEIAECLMACTMTPEQLGASRDKVKWRESLASFCISSPDGLIEKFGDEILNEVERLKLAAVESLGKAEAQ